LGGEPLWELRVVTVVSDVNWKSLKIRLLRGVSSQPENILSVDDRFAGDFALLRTEGQKREGERMKLKTKIRAGKIRPNHNVTVNGSAASSFATGTIAAQAAKTAEVVIPAASTSGR
jgi:hypothetical protein